MTKSKHKTDKEVENQSPIETNMPVEENLTANEESENAAAEASEAAEGADAISAESEVLSEKIAEWKDRYLRLTAEYDNYRKRTLKEREELVRTAGEGLIKDVLVVVDDFERALLALEKLSDTAGFDGINLIYDKLMSMLKSKGVTVINRVGEPFDTDFEEAITKFPAPTPEQKGTVIDVVQKGYLLNGKVIRYAKVVVGE
ncbi:nucleotide exchange factor GrpE [Acetobacteroides hydrogenigenes]|uniref:Protein GrpE n=1 Tax=Acetobacteroides hydrogenigenes TaxID=979970 RepID=A0A4V2RQW2_9BACT|nr:nucleotide exchange factor GrpE [Acetobacteroides hydrogenigenes]TCN73121.1 molecular chaperone GrpE [Acetobacteroides hydrogenigenes]